MKRFKAFALVMVSVFLLIGCGYNSQKAVAAVISEKVTKIDLHTVMVLMQEPGVWKEMKSHF